MKAMEAVRVASDLSGVAETNIGPMMGRSRSYVAVKVSKGNCPQADNLAAMLKACGYALCAVPESDVPESALVIDPS